jgi:hypothetical protein
MDNSEAFQVPTLVAAGLILLVCMCYLLIFVNPYMALNPFKPPIPTATLGAALILPPTWTPTGTIVPASTWTPSVTPIPSLTQASTRLPTSSRTITRTRTRTPVPPPAPPSSPFVYQTIYQGCQHSGGTFIEGTVYRTAAGELEAGARVAMSSAPSGAQLFIVQTGGRNAGYYLHVLNPDGPKPGTYFVWVVDGGGNALSDPYAGRVTTNSLGADSAGSCWRAAVDFVHK